MERACRPLCGLQAGAASREDEDRLLLGCEPTRRLPYHLVRLSGIPVSGPRKTMWREGTKRIFAHSFQPAASPKALTFISRTIRRWTLHHSSDKSLPNLAEMRGWSNSTANSTEAPAPARQLQPASRTWTRKGFRLRSWRGKAQTTERLKNQGAGERQ